MHPLDLLPYCPKCGSQNFPINSHCSRKCTDCGFEFFKNPSIGAAAFAFDDDGKLAVVRRTKNPAKGTLDLPGGFADIGETIEEAIKRELREETNMEVEVESYLFSIPNTYVYGGIDAYPLDFFFKCRIVDKSNIAVDVSENSELLFLAPEEINPEDFGLASVRKAITRFITLRK